MAISLLQVGEHISLDYDSSDHQTVRDFIREQFPEVSTKPVGIAIIVSFGGEQFTFQHYWDDPCLISSTDGGDALLRHIHTQLSQTISKSA